MEELGHMNLLFGMMRVELSIADFYIMTLSSVLRVSLLQKKEDQVGLVKKNVQQQGKIVIVTRKPRVAIVRLGRKLMEHLRIVLLPKSVVLFLVLQQKPVPTMEKAGRVLQALKLAAESLVLHLIINVKLQQKSAVFHHLRLPAMRVIARRTVMQVLTIRHKQPVKVFVRTRRNQTIVRQRVQRQLLQRRLPRVVGRR